MSDQEKLTTAGALLLKHSMPTQAAKENFNVYKPLDKEGISDLIHMLLKHGGPEAHEHINNLGKVFFNKATEIGASTPLSDYINDSDERAAILKEYEHKVYQVENGTKSRNDKNAALIELATEYGKRIEKQNLDYLTAKGSTAAKMARTGARGNPKQLAAGTASPMLSTNTVGDPIPIPIKNSFAEGLTPAEMTALSYVGRSNVVLTQLSTSLPGALFKRLSPTVFHEVITIDDCKTKNGVNVYVKDKKAVLGRYTADTNKLIDEYYYKELLNSGAHDVKVRSTLTCEAHEGVCKHCYGLMGNGKLPEIGEAVGVIAAQSVSEVLTQAMLSTKHKASVSERKGNAYTQASNILANPADNFQDEATISNVNGKISAIKQTPLGDNQVFVDEHMHFVPRVQGLKVNIGDKVLKGDPLSTGVINPRKLVALKGLGAGRKYMSQELRDIYKGGLDPRHFDLIAKNLLKYVQVEHPGETGFLPGQILNVNTIHKYLDKHKKEVSIDQAEGGVLAKPVHELTAGTFLDGNHIQDLKDRGIKTVHVSNSGLTVRPVVPGLLTNKLLDSDWISKLSFSKLKSTLEDSAALGSESPVHSTDPITPYVLGREFGDPMDGKY